MVYNQIPEELEAQLCLGEWLWLSGLNTGAAELVRQGAKTWWPCGST